MLHIQEATGSVLSIEAGLHEVFVIFPNPFGKHQETAVK
jgi:hypothetical protein